MPLVVQSYKQPCSGRRATTILLLYEVGLLLLLDKVEESKWERVVVSGKTEDKIVQEEEPPPGIDSTRVHSYLFAVVFYSNAAPLLLKDISNRDWNVDGGGHLGWTWTLNEEWTRPLSRSLNFNLLKMCIHYNKSQGNYCLSAFVINHDKLEFGRENDQAVLMGQNDM